LPVNTIVRRVFVEKQKEFAVEAKNLFSEIKENLKVKDLEEVRIVNRYDVQGLEESEFVWARDIVFSEPAVDWVQEESLLQCAGEAAFAVEFLPGQYDQRADSAAQCIQLLTQKDRPVVRAAKVVILKGQVSREELDKIKDYCVNPLDSREASMEKPHSLELDVPEALPVETLHGFIDLTEAELAQLMQRLGLAMNQEDLVFCQQYFKSEKRNPTLTEIKVIDTYWSDHCRHTTFLTHLKKIHIEEGLYNKPVQAALEMYLKTRSHLYIAEDKDISLMDLATISMKRLRKEGKLQDLEVSDEINACSILVDADIKGKTEKWLLMFKNETHNHPTEIEPFGGAATCLGGAIRDPLSGRSYVFGAMRVTGSADPRGSLEETLRGKLSQRKITTGAAAGFSSYGNQIGLATGQVAEIYHPGYIAKRMEIGAVLGAAPLENVKREAPEAGDIIVLLGGRTGRDGCGGATGSSKEHDDSSMMSCGAQVQKGNPPTERKIQRLFKNPDVSKMIKKCNDFGAGGVAVAIGELAEGLKIDLDAVPKKYEGLDGTELAISESQERMAVVLAPKDFEEFLQHAGEENLEAIQVARVTEEHRLVMLWSGTVIVDLSRDFLNTNGVKQHTEVYIKTPPSETYFELAKAPKTTDKMKRQAWLENLQDLNNCSQEGLAERFDSTIGSATVLLPLGGKKQLTPTDGLVMKLPVIGGDTNTGAVMAYGFNPFLSSWSPFHGAVYAIVEAVTKAAALGGDCTKMRLTLQEYFEKLGKDPEKWGKPTTAMLGAYFAQEMLDIPAIGGKDSMSGTFKDISVPPTLVAFAVDTMDVHHAVSPELKKADSSLVLLKLDRDAAAMPDFSQLKSNLKRLNKMMKEKKVLSASIVKHGGVAAAITKMCFGNWIGVRLDEEVCFDDLFSPDYGSILLEMNKEMDIDRLLDGLNYSLLGSTQAPPFIEIGSTRIALEEALDKWQQPLSKVFPNSVKKISPKEKQEKESWYSKGSRRGTVKTAQPRVLIPVFPGTNCEYDTAAAFQRAGGRVRIQVIRNLTPKDIEDSIENLTREIRACQMIALPGGFSAGDEPDGSGKFIAAMFRNPRIKEEIMSLLRMRDGLMLGICNGFQALIKLGLVPYGEIRDMDSGCPTLTYNTSGKHISRMADTRLVSNLSPWFAEARLGETYSIPVSHGEGRFVCSPELYGELLSKGQIATKYEEINPNGSIYEVEGITSPDGRILGKMGHSERLGNNVGINVPGHKDQRIFEAGIQYFL
jgi:phosphoribosylformylglycinamidine synthase